MHIGDGVYVRCSSESPDPKATYNAALMAIEASQLVHGFKVALDDFFTCLTEDRQGGKTSYPAAISLI